MTPADGTGTAPRKGPIGILPGLSVMLDLAAFTRLKLRIPGLKPRGRSCARVAERQTRWLQVPVSERAWGFKSPLAHASETPQSLDRGVSFCPADGPGLGRGSTAAQPGIRRRA